MNKRTTLRVLGALLVVTIAGSAAPAAASDNGKADPAPTFGNCKKSYTSGAGATKFAWCFTTAGSVRGLEHPAGVLNIAAIVDGFCLAAPGVGSYVSQSLAPTLQAPTYPNATSVAHKTIDNKFIVTESFAQTTASKTVTVTMKVQNVSGVAQPLALTRIADFDAGGSFDTNVYTQTGRAVLASEPGVSTAVLAAATTGLPVKTLTIPFDTADEISVTALDGDCDNPAGDANVGPSGPLDQMAAVRYDLGTLNNNVTKTVKFTYQVLG